MMETWTYEAIRQEQCESPAPLCEESEVSETVKSEDYELEGDEDAENILDTDDQEITKNCKQV